MTESAKLEMKAYEDPKAFRPFTINKRTNSEMVNLILGYYLKGRCGDLLDITFGAGTFWKNRNTEDWYLEAYDAEPLTPYCKKGSWNELPELLQGVYTAIFFDPPYSSGKGGFELDQVEGYRRMAETQENAGFTDRMKYGDGIMPLPLEKLLHRRIRRDGLLIFKNQELQRLRYFDLYDYLIQDNGFQPDGFKLSKPKARPNHAFWMIFKPRGVN